MKTYDKAEYTKKLAKAILEETKGYSLDVVDTINGFIRHSHNDSIVEIQYIDYGIFVIDPMFTTKNIASQKYAIDTSAYWYAKICKAIAKINMASSKAYSQDNE